MATDYLDKVLAKIQADMKAHSEKEGRLRLLSALVVNDWGDRILGLIGRFNPKLVIYGIQIDGRLQRSLVENGHPKGNLTISATQPTDFVPKTLSPRLEIAVRPGDETIVASWSGSSKTMEAETVDSDHQLEVVLSEWIESLIRRRLSGGQLP